MPEDTIADLLGQIKPLTIFFQDVNNAKALLIVAKSGPETTDRRFTRMPEGRMAEIVTHADGFDQIFIQPQSAADGSCDLRHFQGVREPSSIVVARRTDEDLGFVHKPAKRFRVNDPVSIALELHSNRRWFFPDSAIGIPASRSQW